MDALDLIVKKLDDIDNKLDKVMTNNHRVDKRVVRLEAKAKYIYTMGFLFVTTMLTYLKKVLSGDA